MPRGGYEDTRLEANAKDPKKNPRPRPALARTDPHEAKDRNARGQGHKRKCSPKTKKRSSKNFSGDLQKKRFSKIFSGDLQNFNNSKKVLSSSQGQGNFRGLEASRPWQRTSKCVLEDSTSGMPFTYCGFVSMRKKGCDDSVKVGRIFAQATSRKVLDQATKFWINMEKTCSMLRRQTLGRSLKMSTTTRKSAEITRSLGGLGGIVSGIISIASLRGCRKLARC